MLKDLLLNKTKIKSTMDLNKFHIYFRNDNESNFMLSLSFSKFNLNTSLGEFMSEMVKHIFADSSSYGMFECLNGVEKLVGLDETTSLWTLLEAMLDNEQLKYVVRRMSGVEMETKASKTERQLKKVKKFYQNYNRLKKQQEQKRKQAVVTSTPRNKFVVVQKSKRLHCLHRIYVNKEMLFSKTIVTTTTDTFAAKWTRVIAREFPLA